MKIAIPFENGLIFQHFGHTAQFKVYTVENDTVTAAQVIPTLGKGHGALSEFLHALDVDTVICGGIGGGAQNALAGVGIRLFGGVAGSADDAVVALLNGNLHFDPFARCDHHDHGEHSCGHTCHE